MTLDKTLASLLAPDHVRVRTSAASKDDLLRDMVGIVASSAAVRDPARLLADVEAREARMSTGVGQGLALPHARTDAVTETVASFATLSKPVDYDALDGDPVRLVLLLAGPEAERSGHVRLLSRVSRLMSDPAFRDRLLSAKSTDAVLVAFREAEDRLI